MTLPPHSPITTRKSVKSAFTLIELLVVIAIIAILAAILFPVFARARENARKTSCLSNMKQMGLGILQYTQDYDEKLPMRQFGGAGLPGDGTVFSWRRQIFPYVKSTQLFLCPSNSSNNIRADDSNAANMTASGLAADAPVFFRSYAINGANTFGGTSPSEYNRAASLAELASSAEIVLVTENSQGRGFTGDITPGEWGDPNYVFKGHLATVNFLFCDGHAKALKPIGTASPKNLWSAEDDGAITDATALTRLNNWQQLVDKS